MSRSLQINPRKQRFHDLFRKQTGFHADQQAFGSRSTSGATSHAEPQPPLVFLAYRRSRFLSLAALSVFPSVEKRFSRICTERFEAFFPMRFFRLHRIRIGCFLEDRFLLGSDRL